MIKVEKHYKCEFTQRQKFNFNWKLDCCEFNQIPILTYFYNYVRIKESFFAKTDHWIKTTEEKIYFTIEPPSFEIMFTNNRFKSQSLKNLKP